MARTPTLYEVGQAAEHLGVDVFDLAWALRDAADISFRREMEKVRDFESPNFGKARALLRAAQQCDEAWRVESRESLTAVAEA